MPSLEGGVYGMFDIIPLQIFLLQAPLSKSPNLEMATQRLTVNTKRKHIHVIFIGGTVFPLLPSTSAALARGAKTTLQSLQNAEA